MNTIEWLLRVDPNYINIILITIFFTLEQLIDTPFKFKKRAQHLVHNVLVQLSFLVVNFFYAIFLVFCFNWLNNHHIGLFYLIDMPYWIKMVLGVALFDMTSYWTHRLAHRVPLLWRFHRVHHSDTTVDSSTAFRAHPIEVTLVFANTAIIGAAVFGLDLTTFGLYNLILLPQYMIQHSNIRNPLWMDKTIGKIIVTPNLHKIHHEQDQFHTDSIYSDIFIVWDRLFGTFTYKPLNEINLGLKEFDSNRKQTFWYLMKSPFLNIRRIGSDEIIQETQDTNQASSNQLAPSEPRVPA